MSTPNDNQPSPAAVEQALAEEKANQYWIGATVQVARASATQPQLVMVGGELQMRVWNPMAEEYDYTDVPALAEYYALQAQRDELLAALKDCANSLERLPNVDGAFRVTCLTQARVAIARATEGRKANES